MYLSRSGLCRRLTILDYGVCRYAAPLYVDMKKTVITREQAEEGEATREEEEEFPKVFIGEVHAHFIFQLTASKFLFQPQSTVVKSLQPSQAHT